MRSNWLARQETESDWVSISDLMSVLMIIFLFIAITFMHNLQQDQLSIKKVAVAYQELQINLYDELLEEFKDDLQDWGATIEKETLTIRFQEPDVLFDMGSAKLTKRFRDIISDFFPRYISIIYSAKYKDNIEEIRIEGHTSLEWTKDADENESYFGNMALSQNRTRSVLKYSLSVLSNVEHQSWTKRYITANGLSSSRLIL
ncbi:MAG: OmpA family protein, partial [Thermodesulfobacteriota bacterium]